MRISLGHEVGTRPDMLFGRVSTLVGAGLPAMALGQSAVGAG